MTKDRTLRAITGALVASWRTEHAEHYLDDHAVVALASAIENDGLWVAYQPIVDLIDSRTVAFEALVRPSPHLAAVLPDAPSIVRAAERSGLIRPLGALVMATALTDAARWRTQAAPSLQVHVNASPLELGRAGYLEQVTTMLSALNLPGGALVIEVTESAALDREGAAQHALVALSAAGIDVALDDFGTGFASLDLLATTPARVLKLDRSFTTALGDTQELVIRGRALVTQATVGMARSLGLALIGEGIETVEQARTLASWGCQYGQGYLYGRPTPAASLDLRSVGAAPAGMIARRTPLSPAAVDLGIALARVLAATDVDHGALRVAAMQAATVIASAIGTDRRRGEAATLLAAIADAPMRIAPLLGEGTALDDDLAGLLKRLSVAPLIRRDTSAGAIARTAWAVASSKTRGDAAPDPALLAAHPDSAVDAEIKRRIEQWWQAPIPRPPHPQEALRTLEQQLTARSEIDNRLRSFVGLARAIGANGSLAEVLAVVAEEGRQLVGAATVVITRWDLERQTTQPLVAVGETDLPDELGAAIDQARYPISTARNMQRMIHFEVRGDTDGDPGEQGLLHDLGHSSSACVPIIVEDGVWGILYATTAISSPAFTLADGPVLSAIASFLAAAVTRVENLAQLSRMAFEDPLTGAANRQRLASHSEAMLADDNRTGQAAAASVAITNLRAINQAHGHKAGDEVLRRLTRMLSTATAELPDAMVARRGGDELCVVAAVGPDALTKLGQALLATARADKRFLGDLSIGVAGFAAGDASVTDLVGRASQVQRAARTQQAQLARTPTDSDADVAAIHVIMGGADKH